MSALINLKKFYSEKINIYHTYTQFIIPTDFIHYTNNCANYTYKKCNNCGIQWLSGLEEIINNYYKVINDIYFINDKEIRMEEFYGLTCDEVMIKIALE